MKKWEKNLFTVKRSQSENAFVEEKVISPSCKLSKQDQKHIQAYSNETNLQRH